MSSSAEARTIFLGCVRKAVGLGSAGMSQRCSPVPVATVAIILFAALWWATNPPTLEAQQARRVNRVIEALAAGRPAITGETWAFMDREHRPYDITEIRASLGKVLDAKNSQGQPTLAPIVRIPPEGDQNVRWIIKQVLESGAMGVVIPQVESAEQALRITEAMRYPQLKSSPYKTPRGRRGCGCSGGANWGLSDPTEYVRVADLWPLNPQGELIVLPMIETPEGVASVDAILETPGVTGVLVGPTDLTMNYGEGRWNSPEDAKPDTLAAIGQVARACRAKKKHCGMVTANEAQTEEYIAAGFTIIFATYRPGASM